MKKASFVFLICITLLTLLVGYRSAQASHDYIYFVDNGPMKIDPAVQASVGNLQPGELLTVIITLRQQADFTKVNGTDRAARLQGVIQALQATANATQGRLTGLLNSYRSQGLVESFTPLWVFNGFSVTGTREAINSLFQDPDVLAITPDDLQIVPVAGAPEPNIALVNAPALWSQGYTGQGIVVASMDSGVDASHPDLASRWRGGSNSWFDPYGQHSQPADLSGHGTWTTGIMVGGDADGTSIGVAPDAQWIAVKIFDDQGKSSATAIHQGFQWLLDPDNNPSTADAPNVVNNSWTYANPGCYLDFEPDLQSLRAAGILPVFAAGNGGPYSDTSYSPANNPSAFAVGAVDNNGQIYAYSSRGPTTCGGSTGPYPELVAPGVNVKTTGLLGSYTTESGTSLASPHVAGGLALLLSAYPNLDAGMQEQSLINTAIDLGASGPDDVFGYGLLDLSSALSWASTAPTSTPAPTFTPSPTLTSSPSPTTVPNVNLALNKSVTVSSLQDSAHDGVMAADGDLATQWQTQKVKGKNKLSSEWIEIDLGSSQNVSQVVLEWDAYFASSYSIQTSTNGTAWSTVFSTSNGDGGNDTISFSTVQARYVKLDSSAWSNGSYRNWLNEFEIYAVVNSSSVTPTSTSSSTPTNTPTSAQPPTSTATTEPTATPLDTATLSPTPTAGTRNSIHIGDLDAFSPNNGKSWDATVLVLVHDTTETPLQGVTVRGSWSNGANGSGSCTTGADGICNITLNNLKNNVGSVTFTVTDLSASLPYQSSANHDPDGDSDGTVIVVVK